MHENKLLIETSQQMRKQSCRSTQRPLFVIQDLVQKYVPYSEEWEEKELKEEYDINGVCKKCREDMDKIMDGSDEPDKDCEDCDEEIYDYFNWVREFDLRAGIFFSEKACHEHIEQNYYHYHKDVQSYVISAWRNPEMTAVMQELLKLTKGDIPNHYT